MCYFNDQQFINICIILIKETPHGLEAAGIHSELLRLRHNIHDCVVHVPAGA